MVGGVAAARPRSSSSSPASSSSTSSYDDDDDVMNSLEGYVDAAAKCLCRPRTRAGPALPIRKKERRKWSGEPNNLFVDLVPLYSVRLDTLRFMVRQGKPCVHLRLCPRCSTVI